MKRWWSNLWERFPLGRDRAVKWLLWIGVGGVLLIALSEWTPRTNRDAASEPVSVTADAVEQALESRITDLLRSVAGVGDCRVMVTLESDAQSVYAADTAYAADSGSETYLRVESDSGPVGLLLTRIQPTVKGVAVVCDGGDNPEVCRRVQEVVTTAFHISDRRVCVVKQQ